jgi:GNAT superfamily N-acetyltransferase
MEKITAMDKQRDDIEIRPVTPEIWGDMEHLFQQMGSFKGCWCMWWRLKRKDFDRMYGEGNHRAMQEIVQSGQVPGLLAYVDEAPIAWCSVAPREHFPVLDRSPVLKRVDDKPVWSIVCFFISEVYRGQGLMSKLIKAAVAYANQNGAYIVEAYPVIPEASSNPELQSFTGVITAFEEEGFEEVVRRSKIQPIILYFFPLYIRN